MSLTTTWCWILSQPDGTPYTEDYERHFSSRTEAQAFLDVELEGDDEAPAGLRVALLGEACWGVVCDECGAGPGDGEGGTRHFEARADAEEGADDEGWHQDAGRSVCTRCLTRRELSARPARVLVTGSRDWTDADAVTTRLDALMVWTERLQRPGLVIVHGACPSGADAIAEAWARRRGVPTEAHPADWDSHGRAAGPIRNAEMVAAGAEGCLAFIRNHSRGATGCADLAEDAGILTYRIREVDTSTAAAPATSPEQTARCGRPDEPWEIRGDIARGLPARYFCGESLPCPRHGLGRRTGVV